MIYNMLDVSNKSQQYVKACSTVEIASYTNGPDDCVHMKALSKVLTLWLQEQKYKIWPKIRRFPLKLKRISIFCLKAPKIIDWFARCIVNYMLCW